MYTSGYERRGILPVVGGTAVLRNNDISTFTLEVNARDVLSSRFEKGWRVVIEDEGRQLCAGAPAVMGRSSDSGAITLELSGSDDMVWLRDMITLPNPSAAADQQDQDAYYKASGGGAPLIYDLVRRLVGQNARAEFKRPLIVENPAVLAGKTLSLNTRFKTVLEEVQSLAQQSSSVVSLRQDDVAKSTVMSIGKGRDLSRVIRMTEINGGIGGWDLSEEAPTVTSVLVAGQGEGTARTLKLVNGNSNEWGFRGLQFQDRRDTDAADELILAGEETLDEGRAKASISVEINETPAKRFGRDFGLGDTITVQLASGVLVTDVVQTAEISWGSTGREVKLTIGPVAEEQDAPRWVPLVKSLQAQIRALQAR